MEREQELRRLSNVLRRIARSALYTDLNRTEPDAARFCAAQFNRVLKRVAELEPAAGSIFPPLSESASPEVISIATADLMAFISGEAESGSDSSRRPRRPRVVVLAGHRFGRDVC